MILEKIRMKIAVNNIKGKILIAIFTVLVLSLILCALSIYFYVKGILSRQMIDYISAYESKSCQQLSYYLENVITYSRCVSADNQVQDCLERLDSSQEKDYDYYSTIKRLQNTLRAYKMEQSATIDDIYTVGNEGETYTIPDYDDTSGNGWLGDFLTRNSDSGFTEIHLSPGDMPTYHTYVTSYVADIYDVNNIGNQLGKVVVNLRYDVIEKTLNTQNRPFQTVFLYNGSNLLCKSGPDAASSVKSKILKQLQGDQSQIIRDGYNNYYFIEPVQGLDFYMVGVLSQKNLNAELHTTFFFFMIVVLVCIILVSVMLIPVINNITRPLAKLASGMKAVSKGKLETEISIKSHDEIEYLADVFNGMVRDIKGLIEQSVLKEKREQQIQLRLLMAQINPHFIYNTLNTIIYLARAENTQDIIAVTRAFITILQTAIKSTPDAKISVREEMKDIDSYILILKYRYNNLVRVKWNVEESLLNCLIPKMLIYPLVENSVFHGIFPKTENGEITISVSGENDNVRIEIEDDGIGMSEDKIQALCRDIQTDFYNDNAEHIGMRNVNSRLKLLYHTGLNIESTYGNGTKVWFILPRSTDT